MKHIEQTLKGLPMQSGAGVLPEPEEMIDCDICKGVGWVYLNVPFGHEMFGRAVRCRCRLKKDQEERAQFMLKYCQLPIGSEDYTFETYDRKLGSKEACDAALRVANGELLWLVLNADVDRGKTHLAVAICRHWLSRGKVARYVHITFLLDELREGFDDKERPFEQRFNHFKNVPLLAIDDLGVQKPTDFANEKLQALIDYRCINRLPLVVTVNKALDELPGDDEGRIASRFKRMESSKIVILEVPEYRTVKGQDYRRLKDN